MATRNVKIKDEERTDDTKDLISRVIQKEMTPMKGESFDAYNRRLNNARIEASKLIADARQQGVKVDNKYALNCIATAISNFNDQDMVDSPEKNYDQFGLYQGLKAFSNIDFKRNHDNAGFGKVASYSRAGKDYDEMYPDDIRRYRKRMHDATANVNDGDLAMKDSSHMVTFRKNADNKVITQYAPGDKNTNQYRSNDSGYYYDSDGLNDDYTYYRYQGTPEEIANRRKFYDWYQSEGLGQIDNHHVKEMQQQDLQNSFKPKLDSTKLAGFKSGGKMKKIYI